MPAMQSLNRQIATFTAGLLLGSVLVTWAGTTAASSAPPADAQTAAKSTAKVVLENARVRVRDVTFPPGVTGMHTHDLAHVGIVIQGTFRYPDGKSETMKLEAGGVGFREANVSHEPTNPGTAPVRVIEVELK
jgi:quercetin dioxygenase-like cupin family protein